ncbi:MAG: ABC transporter substrate-binding protein [Cryomorphaceae bacterium]|nr:ABC transporter substrate-binding protein [Cryomorphaceae bacterium]
MNSFFKLFFVLAVFTGCHSPVSDQKHLVFRYNEPAGINSLDPAYARAQSGIWTSHQIFSTLVELDSDLQVVPGLAKTWQISEDGTLYTFNLKSGVHFHPHPSFTGARLLKADDVVYSLYRLKDPAVSSPGAWIMGWVDTVFTTNDTTVCIQLQRSFSPFIRVMSMKYTSIVPREAVESTQHSFAELPSGTGPFYLKRWVPGDRLILRRFDNYYAPLPDNGIQSVVVRFITDKLSAFLAFLKGDLDFISGLDVSYRDDIIDEHGQLRDKYRQRMRLESTSFLNTEYLAFNTEKLNTENSPYADARIRQAIALSIDLEQLTRYLLSGMGSPARFGMTPPSLHRITEPLSETNRDHARALLTQAGYPNGKGLPTLMLHTNPGYQDMAEFIQSEVKKIGIPLKVDVGPPSTLRQQIATGKVDFFRASWIADYPDVENYMLLFFSDNIPPSGPNYSRFQSVEADALYRQLAKSSDPAERDSIHTELERIIHAETPVIPLFYDKVIRLINPKIQGFPINALNLLELREVVIEHE